MEGLTTLVQSYHSSITMFIRTTHSKGTEAFVKPFVTSSALLIEVGQPARVPVSVMAGLDVTGVNVRASRPESPIAACQ